VTVLMDSSGLTVPVRPNMPAEPMGARGGQQARVCSPSSSRRRGASSGVAKGAASLDGAGHGEGMEGGGGGWRREDEEEEGEK